MTLAFRPILHERTGADDDRRRVHPARPEAAPHAAREDARRAHARAAPHGAGGPPEGEHDRVDPLAPRAHGGQRRALRAPEPPAHGLAGGRLRGDARPAARRAGHRHADGRGAGAPPPGPGALPRVRAEGVGGPRRGPHGDAGGADVSGGLAPLVGGRDPRAWEALVTLLSAVRRQAAGGVVQQAIGAIENALLDLTAKALGVPVYALFGGPGGDRIRLYRSHCGTYRPAWAAEMQLPPLRTLDDVVKA